jgi:hypothetical protein
MLHLWDGGIACGDAYRRERNAFWVLQVTFMWVAGAVEHSLTERVSGTRVRIFASEVAMLQAWLSYVQQHNPDAFLVFQVTLILATFNSCHSLQTIVHNAR